jgi:hypothetical protein
MVVIGVGNEYRRDDGAGLAVVARLRDRVPPGVEIVLTDGEPIRLIEAWTGAALAVAYTTAPVSLAWRIAQRSAALDDSKPSTPRRPRCAEPCS